MTNQSPLRGAMLGFAAMGLYALNDITTKFLGGSYNPVQILFFSGMAGFPLVMLQMMADKESGHLRPVLPMWTAARVLIVVINGLIVSYAFTQLPLAQAYAIFFLMPLFICVLAAVVLGEPIDLARGSAVVVGLVGVVIALRPTETPLTLAHLAAFCGAFFGALYYIILRKTGGAERMAVILIYPMIAQTAVVAVMLPFVYQPMSAVHLGLTGLMALEGFLGSLCIVAAYRLAPAIVVAPMQYSQIIWASLFGTFFFGEPMDAATVIGIAIIIASGLFIMLRSNQAPRATLS